MCARARHESACECVCRAGAAPNLFRSHSTEAASLVEWICRARSHPRTRVRNHNAPSIGMASARRTRTGRAAGIGAAAHGRTRFSGWCGRACAAVRQRVAAIARVPGRTCRGRAHPCHICAGTGLAPAHICAGTGLAPARICAGTGLAPATSAAARVRVVPAVRSRRRRCVRACVRVGGQHSGGRVGPPLQASERRGGSQHDLHIIGTCGIASQPSGGALAAPRPWLKAHSRHTACPVPASQPMRRGRALPARGRRVDGARPARRENRRRSGQGAPQPEWHTPTAAARPDGAGPTKPAL